MKKTYTVTYCEWSSYGSILQSLALQKSLKKYGIENKIIKAEPKPLDRYKNERLTFSSPKEFIKKFLNLLILGKTAKRYKKCQNFINNNADIEYFGNYDNLKNNPPEADCFIAGSDQIWHPDHCNKTFFLDFAKNNTKKISYAASMGKTTVGEEKKDEFKRLINNFDTISVRESDNIDVIRQFTDKNVVSHIDPTFLLSKEEWEGYQKKYSIKKPYILVYAIYWNESLNLKLKSLSKKTGLPIIAICTSLNKVTANKKIYDADVSEFLWLINNAEYIITSSFHGVAFSTIFNKQFSAVINPRLPSRITCLMQNLEIPIISIENLCEKEYQINYDTVNLNILKEKEKSITYLLKELNIEK